MPAWLQSLLLGALQGLTEFLPVSSSGHLVLLQAWLGDVFAFADSAVAFDLALHVGTLLPVIFFYRRDLEAIVMHPRREWSLIVQLGLATLPTVVIGLGLRDVFEELFHTVPAVAVAMLFTGVLLASTRWSEARSGRVTMNIGRAIIIGCAQGLAITPGVSRSGTTIAVALLLGVGREEAARFSFLMSIPAIAGAALLVAKDGVPFGREQAIPLALGFVTAAVVGYAALRWLVFIVKRGRLYRFAWYLVPLALLTLFLTAR